MKLALTSKVRLYPTNEQAQEFTNIANLYRDVCNVVSQWVFDHHFEVGRNDFNHQLYHDLRKGYPSLNSAMVQSTYRTVEARYKTVKQQLFKHPYHFQNKNTGKWYSYNRDLSWLHNPIKFSRPQADYVRNINYSFVKQGTLISLNVLSKRIKVKFNDKYTQDWFTQNAKLGTAKLVQSSGHWFLHIPVTMELDGWNKATNKHIVGIDRGLRQVMTIYDECGNTKFFNGKSIAYKRKKFAYLRRQLQSKGTKSAKRHLKRLGQRENRWMSDVNHQLSKTLVDYYGSDTLFVIEDLTNVTFERRYATKDATHDLHSWSFYDLAMKLTYKAHKQRAEVLTVSAAYTSQRCPKCGQIRKDNRNHKLHLYKCDHCGFTTNDDRVGAMNLYDLGKQYMAGNEHPKIELNNNVND